MADHPASRDRESNGLGITYETGNIQDLATKIDQLSDDETRKTLIEIRLNQFIKTILMKRYHLIL